MLSFACSVAMRTAVSSEMSWKTGAGGAVVFAPKEPCMDGAKDIAPYTEIGGSAGVFWPNGPRDC